MIDSKPKILNLKNKILKLLFENPENEKVKRLFLEANILKINEEENIDLFGFLEDEAETLEKNLKQVKILNPREVVDPPFGMKASMCLGDTNSIQLALLKNFEKEGPAEALRLLNVPSYSPFVDDKKGRGTLKYQSALKDLEKLQNVQGGEETVSNEKDPIKKSQFSVPVANVSTGDPTQKPLTYKMFSSDPEEQKKLVQKITNTWMGAYNRKDYYKFISRDKDKHNLTISPLGAGQIEFLVRIYLYAKTNTYKGIPSQIQLQPHVSRERAQEEEVFLVEKLGFGVKGKIESRTHSILDSYLRTAVYSVMETFIKKRDLEEFIDSGISLVFDKISQYDQNSANFAAWAFQIIKNNSKNILTKRVDYQYDDENALEWVYSLPTTSVEFVDDNGKKKVMNYYVVKSNLPTNKASGMFVSSKTQQYGDKIANLYYYENTNDVLEDLRIANGYYENINKTLGVSDVGAGRPKKYDPNNPLFYKNLPQQVRKNIMSSSEKGGYMDIEGVKGDDVSLAYSPEELENKLDLQSTRNVIKDISDNIFNQLVNAPTGGDPYSFAQIRSFAKDNSELTKAIISALLNYGIYEYQERQVAGRPSSSGKTRDKYQITKWVTKPEKVRARFIQDLKDNMPSGMKLSSEISNAKGNKISIDKFISSLRTAILGSGTGSGKGFLIQNPEYLAKIKSLLKTIPADVVTGRENPQTYDELKESLERTSKVLNEVQLQIKKFTKETINNFINSWKN